MKISLREIGGIVTASRAVFLGALSTIAVSFQSYISRLHFYSATKRTLTNDRNRQKGVVMWVRVVLLRLLSGERSIIRWQQLYVLIAHNFYFKPRSTRVVSCLHIMVPEPISLFRCSLDTKSCPIGLIALPPLEAMPSSSSGSHCHLPIALQRLTCSHIQIARLWSQG